jgi:nucleoside-diphosphate-sugar epimerase
VFHLAGNTSVYAASEDPVGSINSSVLPLIHAVTASRLHGKVPVIVLASTATVYGMVRELPVSEEVLPAPVTNYDLHKLFAEKQLLLGTALQVVHGVALRIANVYGHSPSPHSAIDRGVITKIAKLALAGSSIPLFGGGQCLRDYVHIDDVIEAFLAVGITAEASGRALNVASGTGVLVRDAFHLVARQVREIAGKSPEICDTEWPDGIDPIEQRNFVGNVSALTNVTGWRPTVSLESGVRSLIVHLVADGAA